MPRRTLKVALTTGIILVMVSGVIAGKGDYSWEKWALPGNIDCVINYDGDGDGRLEEYYPVSVAGYFTFRAGIPYDYVIPEQCDWVAVFEAANGLKIKLIDATLNDLKNEGWKENFYIYPETHCLKYLYEATGTWCGYDQEKGIYFWGTWSTLPQGRPYYVDYILSGDTPTLRGQWRVVGCSDYKHAFEISEGCFIGTRLEYGLD
ncbi:hypothetical protein JXM67_03505 [candidate division WOR-3 bacterium]|nr:hypothetical protein [candidate division WOR-3 bacterium]